MRGGPRSCAAQVHAQEVTQLSCILFITTTITTTTTAADQDELLGGMAELAGVLLCQAWRLCASGYVAAVVLKQIFCAALRHLNDHVLLALTFSGLAGWADVHRALGAPVCVG